MGRRIAVSKAARMLGVNRAELNKRLAAAKIETFEGEVDFEQVKCIAPTLETVDPHLQRLKRLREAAVQIDADAIAGSEEDLRERIRKLTIEARIEAETADDYRNIIEDVVAKLGELQASDDPGRRRVGFELCEWLRNKVATSG